MNIWDITEHYPEVGFKYLEKIYELQNVLIDHYVNIEGLPPYPLDVNSRDNQALLKDFGSRFIEELSEGFEAYVGSREKVLLGLSGLDPTEDVEGTLKLLLNFNEEQADAMHFIIELLIFSNIQPEDILNFIKKHQKNISTARLQKGDILELAMDIGYMTFMEYMGESSIDGFITVNYCDRFKEVEEYNSYIEYIRAGHIIPINPKVNQSSQKVSMLFLWHITHFLNLSRSLLKNKPWKQSETITNEEAYQSQLVQTFILYMGYLKFIGMKSEDIYFLYFKKNRVNLKRIESKY